MLKGGRGPGYRKQNKQSGPPRREKPFALPYAKGQGRMRLAADVGSLGIVQPPAVRIRQEC